MEDPEKPDVKEFPVGSVCVIIHTVELHEVLGKEVTILEPLHLCTNTAGYKWWGYSTDFVWDGYRMAPMHSQLRLKEDPEDVNLWAKRKIAALLSKVAPRIQAPELEYSYKPGE